MRPAQQGFLLLCSHLGDPERPVLTVAQFRNLARRIRETSREDGQQELTCDILMAAGYDRVMAQRIVRLLKDEEQLQWYLTRGGRQACFPITRISETYPAAVRKRLGLDAPGCLWAKGDPKVLNQPAIALVGSRDLHPQNRLFAQEVGRQAALQGYVLVSGNARGADKTAQDACLAAGGRVISVVADTLADKPLEENLLWLSEDGYDQPFSSQRALNRNRVIHSFGLLTLVAQSALGKGGTWDGTGKNLRQNWSTVCCFADGSEAARELVCMGAVPVNMEALSDFSHLRKDNPGFLDL